MLTKIKDQIKGGLELVHLSDFGAANLNEVDNILVLEELEDPDFPEGRYGELQENISLIIICIFHTLDLTIFN